MTSREETPGVPVYRPSGSSPDQDIALARPDGSRETEPVKGRILVVDDEELILRMYRRALTKAGYSVISAPNGQAGCELIGREPFDVIISDISMPEMDGVEFLRRVRARDAHIPVVFITGVPAVESAVQAVEYGAFRYLVKPVTGKELEEVVEQAVKLHQLARDRQQAMVWAGEAKLKEGDAAELESRFERAIGTLWIAYQPIICWSGRKIHAFEALLRSREPTLSTPSALLSAAERLGRLDELGRGVRAHVAKDLKDGPADTMFVNLHTRDLLDDALYVPSSPLSKFAHRVVLEITERVSLSEINDVSVRASDLRKMGYRIAVDDLGAGYAGLSSFAQLIPEVVKLDMSLVRDVHKESTKRKLIQTMITMCREMRLHVVAEGVECLEERDALVEIGCDLLQGFLFAEPGPAPRTVAW